MTEMKATIVIEYNCYLSTDSASIWFFPSTILEGSAVYELEAFPQIDTAVRILGPVASEIANTVYENLSTCLLSLGVDLTRYAIADD